MAHSRPDVKGIDLHPPIMHIQRAPEHQVGHRRLDRELLRLMPARLRQRQRRRFDALLLKKAEAEISEAQHQAPAHRHRIRPPQEEEQGTASSSVNAGSTTAIRFQASLRCENGSHRCVP